MDDMVDEEWDRLVESGAVVPTGTIDEETGEAEYIFDLPVLKVVFPELYHAYLDDIDEAVLSLSEKGLVAVDLSEEVPQYHLTDAGIEYMQKYADIINET